MTHQSPYPKATEPNWSPCPEFLLMCVGYGSGWHRPGPCPSQQPWVQLLFYQLDEGLLCVSEQKEEPSAWLPSELSLGEVFERFLVNKASRSRVDFQNNAAAWIYLFLFCLFFKLWEWETNKKTLWLDRFNSGGNLKWFNRRNKIVLTTSTVQLDC